MARMRKLTLHELFRFQGIALERLRIPAGVSERQVRGMIGNAFNVTVVMQIIDRLLFSSGLTSHPCGFQSGTGEEGERWPEQSLTTSALSEPASSSG
eukprot:711194-Amphidinium_carterae.1